MNKLISVATALAALAVLAVPRTASASCASPANAIEAENCLAGTPSSTWDISGIGDSTIQGFATDISVNKGGTVGFKIKTAATAWRLDIYRMGYYAGNGARLVTSVSGSGAQNQPACLAPADGTGLVDCGNWSTSASWAVPTTAVSGIYFARAIRTDTGGASHIVFVVRDDASHSNLLFQTSDPTWHAYNDYGGNDLYTGNGSVGRAYKVSYNRPFNTRVVEPETFVWNAEYPMVRWLEANGYDVTYQAGVDTDRNGALITNHKVWLSNGHDEYWSGGQRANVEAARAAGVHLMFLSGNTSFWKTRWEPSIATGATPNRTLVCYKETHANGVIDPQDPPTWTGTWRDPRFSPPADGGRPENALTGLLFRYDTQAPNAITVPQADGLMRLWRNTNIATLAAGQTATLAPGTLGAEVNVDEDNGFRPAGLFGVSTSAVTTTTAWLLDYGSTYGSGSGTNKTTIYKASSGALVFSTGTYDWAWGLDANHDRTNLGSTTDPRMQQATVNILADMGAQPATLQSGLVAATASSDITAPVSSITSPASGATLAYGAAVTVSGTATDLGGGQVAGVEVSTDGGATWHPATGRASWTYSWTTSAAGSVTLKSRAVDDSGNLETPGAGVTVTVSAPSAVSIWSPTATPTLLDGGPDSSVELGVKFKSDYAGQVTGIRFYKASTNTGTHTGSLWSSTGTLLASATFTGETASGWQQVTFATPVNIAANTVYVASYHCASGHYSDDQSFFTSKGVDNPPVHALQSGVSGANGVFAYGTGSTFPNQSWNDSNYWVDVLVKATAPTLSSIAIAPASPTILVGATQQFTATGTYSDGSTQDLTGSASFTSSNGNVATLANSGGLATGVGAGSATITAAVGSVSASTTLTVQSAALAITTASLPGGTQNVAYSATLAASGGKPPYSWSVTGSLPAGLTLTASTGAITGTPTSTGTSSFTVTATDSAAATASKALSIVIAAPADASIWSSTAVPGLVDAGADSSVELGVKFKSDVAGSITGIRFYKSAANTGTHVANVWSSTGTKLATATFSGETASGWQTVLFTSPVAITANTTYVASYHCTGGHYSADGNYFASGVDNAPLHALANSVSSNGVFAYGSTSAFPNQSYNSSNYWVDVTFRSSPPPTLSSIAVTPAAPTINVGATQQFVATGSYSDGSTQNLTSSVTWASASTTVATISAAGLASGVKAGTATISATLGSISGSTVLTVQSVPLSVTTASLPGGNLTVAYSATLAAAGGAPPYSWATTALPPGLTLAASTGAITGTPTATGTFNLTATVTDSLAATASKALSIVIGAAPDATIWPSSTVPALVDGGADSAVELGVKFKSDSDGTIKGIRFYKASTNTGTHIGNLWSSTGTKLATATFSGETASGWQQVLFTTPVSITANTVYVASYHSTIGHYSADSNYFALGFDNPPLHALAASVSPDGVYAYGSTSVFPSSSFNSTNYWVDVVFAAKAAPTLSSIAVTPAAQTIAAGNTLQFTATGTYSDGSTQVLTTSATWASSNTAAATVSSGGLATGVAAGTTTISAAVGTITGSTTLTVGNAPLVIATSSLPGGTQYQTYSATLAATGGKTPYTWSVTPALPAGLSLDPSTGSITGRPSAASTTSLTFKVTDASNTAVSKALALTIGAAPPLTITSLSLPTATKGVAYSATLTATGGLTPYTWSVLATALPPGLSVNAGSGVISGTPTTVGSYKFTTSLTDSVPQSTSATVAMDVALPGAYSFWQSSTVPVNFDSGPDNSVELGVKFTSDSAGFINGIRFYKSTANTGTHVGSLWSSTGTLLASATFTNETASGWQQVNFASPVSINANTTYVASYHAPVGHYAADGAYFTNNSVDNPPLHAPANTNGVYAYGAGSVFPNSTFNGDNYWVDVVLNATTAPPTLTALSIAPLSPSIGLGGSQQFTATGTYSNNTTQDVTDVAAWTSSNPSVAAINTSGTASALALGTGSVTITASLDGKSASTVLTITPPPPPPNEGPGGPILVVSAAANPFSRYLAEILRAEGFNEFLATDISNVTSTTLASYDLVVLGEQPLTAAQVSMFTTWVNNGGRLIAMRPDKQLAGFFGLTDLATTLPEAYVTVAQSGPGAGIVSQSMQFHGTADQYAANGAQTLATLYSGPNTTTTSPAVSLVNAGLGQAAAFTYDLARSVVYTRQGNPLWSGERRDGQSSMRSDDLFFGNASFDPELDWIDFNKVQIPQADEQQRLLANLILTMNKKPLPRFWYLPNGLKAAVVMTGDDHANGGTAGRFDQYISDSPANCSVADWQCVRGTSYIYNGSPLTNTQAASYTAKGFEVALHVSTQCADWASYSDLDSDYASQLTTFKSQYSSAGSPVTNRTHCVAWSDYDSQPKVELAHGIRYDTTYYYWPGSWVNDRPGLFTGSGLPQRFADRAGTTIDVYQSTSQMTDESGMTYLTHIDTLLDNAIGANGYYTVVTANMHTDQVTSTGSDTIVQEAQARGVPIVSSKQMLTWLDGRNNSTFGSVTWNGSVLSFTVTAATGSRNIQAMLPASSQGLTLSSLTAGGSAVSYTLATIKGVSYAVFNAASATYQATYH